MDSQTALKDALFRLPPLRDVIAQHDLMAKKSLGQNFLLDLNLTAKIARVAGEVAGKNVIEVGPGPGGLTRALVGTDAAHIFGIERDERCIAALQDLLVAANGRFTLLAEDALKIDYAAVCPAPRVMVANLPYNIATTLLIGWLRQLHLFDSMTLMFQKEVADRITATPRTKDYGRLSVLVQWLCLAEKKFDLPPAAFTPAPKVTSSIVHLIPRTDRTDTIAVTTMERLTGSAFGQRRKMLRQSLKSLGVDLDKFFAETGISPTARAEEIDIAGFIRMADYLEKNPDKV